MAIASMLLAAAGSFAAAPAFADDADDAPAILKAMSDYVSSQKSLDITFNTDIEVLTNQLQKIQFTSSAHLQLSRPEKLHVTRTGGYTDVELFFDGKAFGLLDKKDHVFAATDAAGTVDQLIAKLRAELGVDMPGADLLAADPYKALSADVLEAKHIGRGVVNGVECEHLAFRNQDTDWQIWIEVGAKPIPLKYVITTKAVTGAPQYTLLITDWKTDVPAAEDAFVLKAPADAKKIEFKDLADIDEVPAGAVSGGSK